MGPTPFLTPLGAVLDSQSSSAGFAAPRFDSSRPLQTATAQKLTFLGRPICAGEKNRTPIYWLEASHFTTKLRPQYFVVLFKKRVWCLAYFGSQFSEVSHTSSIPLNYAHFKIVILLLRQAVYRI